MPEVYQLFSFYAITPLPKPPILNSDRYDSRYRSTTSCHIPRSHYHQNGTMASKPVKLFAADGAKYSGTSPVNVSAFAGEVGTTTVEQVGL